MCGRFTNRMTWKQIHDLYRITEGGKPDSNFPERFNVAPTQRSFVVREHPDGRHLEELRWGLILPWIQTAGEGAKCINARTDGVMTKPSFREAFRKRPCLVVADGYYEWKVLGPKEKQPYHFTTKGAEPFAFAGLFQPTEAGDNFLLLTCTPNPLCAEVHDRMPLMLGQEDWDAWLASPEERAKLVRPFPADRMEYWPVTKAVGKYANIGPELVERIRNVPLNSA